MSLFTTAKDDVMTVEEAIAFIDSFDEILGGESDSVNDATSPTSSSASDSGAVHPAVEAPKPKRKRRKNPPGYTTRMQQKKKAELQDLREQVRDLEQSLELLKRATPPNWVAMKRTIELDTAAMRSKWRKLAATEYNERRRSEQTNRRLKVILVHQVQMDKNLRQVLKKRSLFQGIDFVFGNEPTSRYSFTAFENSKSIMDHLEQRVSKLYLDSDSVFEDEALTSIACSTGMKHKEVLGMTAEALSMTPMLCPMEVAADICWKDLSIPRPCPVKWARCMKGRQPDSHEKNWILKLQCKSYVKEVKGIQFLRKFTEPNRIVIIKTDLMMINNEELQFRDQTWTIISRSTTNPNECLVRVCEQMYLDHEVGISAARPEDVEYAQRVVLKNLSWKLREHTQHLQDMLVEETENHGVPFADAGKGWQAYSGHFQFLTRSHTSPHTDSSSMPASNIVYRHGERSTYENIRQISEPIPELKDHEVLVEVRGVALNYRDLAISKSIYPGAVKDAVVPCSDGAGVIVEVGSAVEDIQVGDRVIINFDVANMYGPVLDGGSHWLGGTLDGMLRQYAVVPAQAVIPTPENCKLTFVQLASLVCAGVTAWNALYGLIALHPGQTVLLQGTGGVSIFGLQIAKAAGATTIVTSSSDDKLEFVKEKFGADHTINYRKTPDWAIEVMRIRRGKGVDFVVETGGSGTIAQSLAAVAQGGHIGNIGFLSSAKQEDMPDVAMLALNKGCIIRGVQIGSKQLAEEFVRVVVSQNIQPHTYKTFEFDKDGVVAAFKCLESGGHIGKIGIAVKPKHQFVLEHFYRYQLVSASQPKDQENDSEKSPETCGLFSLSNFVIIQRPSTVHGELQWELSVLITTRFGHLLTQPMTGDREAKPPRGAIHFLS
ncbi:unnamed protein product [Phytophthora fragariaefolia]|uniref:Unnamed protein product n=1 Tax=Phytophthora fragariaefolia TaxID=1490495 RepID=A0A9W7DB17_9STRA|nr:unnamed protein product [Phytophthora fragariaefolia]